MADVLLSSLTVSTTLPSGTAVLTSRPGATASDRVFGLVAPTALAPVSSVNGQTGAVTLPAGVTSFQSRAGAVSLISADVTGALGFTPYSAANPAGFLTPSTGVTSVNGQVGAVTISAGSGGTAGVSSFQARTGAVTLTSADVTGALTFTPYNATNPAGYVTATTAPVTSVNGQTGAVTISTGTGGTAGVSSFQTRTGAVTLTSADVTGALTFTPYNATNPAGYVTATTAPVRSVNGQTGAVTVGAAPAAEPIRVAAAGTFAVTAAMRAVWINPDVVGAVTLQIAADYPAGERLNLVETRPNADTTVALTGSTIRGQTSFVLASGPDGWASVNLMRSTSLGMGVS